jgi:hypothetical protein
MLPTRSRHRANWRRFSEGYPAIPHKQTAVPLFDLAGTGTPMQLIDVPGEIIGRAIQQLERRITRLAGVPGAQKGRD